MLLLLACSARHAAAATCTMSASNVVFGNYSGSIINVTGTVTVTCTSGTAYDVGLNAGASSGVITNRVMNGPGSALSYSLFNNSARTTNWGNTSGSGWVAGTGTGSAQTLTVYAQLPANQYVTPGGYTDTITASITGNFTTATAQFSVTATVLPACSISANALSFGTYSGSLINSTSIITARCTSSSYNIGLSAGMAAGATVTNRSMTGPASGLLKYKLFRDSARTLSWGNTVGTDTVAGYGDGTVQSLSVYGQVPAGQSAKPGTYADTIIATITY